MSTRKLIIMCIVWVTLVFVILWGFITPVGAAPRYPTCPKGAKGIVVKRETSVPPLVRETVRLPNGTYCYRVIKDSAKPSDQRNPVKP